MIWIRLLYSFSTLINTENHMYSRGDLVVAHDSIKESAAYDWTPET